MNLYLHFALLHSLPLFLSVGVRVVTIGVGFLPVSNVAVAIVVIVVVTLLVVSVVVAVVVAVVLAEVHVAVVIVIAIVVLRRRVVVGVHARAMHITVAIWVKARRSITFIHRASSIPHRL